MLARWRNLNHVINPIVMGKYTKALWKSSLGYVWSLCVCAQPPQCFSHVQLFATPWTVAHQAPLSMEFSRQEYWTGLPCPPLRGFPDSGIKPSSPASPAFQENSFTHWATWKSPWKASVKVKNIQAYNIKEQIVIGKNKSDSLLDLFFLLQPLYSIAFPAAVAYSLIHIR